MLFPSARLCREIHSEVFNTSIQHVYQTMQLAINATKMSYWPPHGLQLHTPDNYIQSWLLPPYL